MLLAHWALVSLCFGLRRNGWENSGWHHLVASSAMASPEKIHQWFRQSRGGLGARRLIWESLCGPSRQAPSLRAQTDGSLLQKPFYIFFCRHAFEGIFLILLVLLVVWRIFLSTRYRSNSAIQWYIILVWIYFPFLMRDRRVYLRNKFASCYFFSSECPAASVLPQTVEIYEVDVYTFWFLFFCKFSFPFLPE